MTHDYFTTAIGHYIWDAKYRYRDGDAVRDHTVADTWHRIARALASVERDAQREWQQRFYNVLEGFKFLPGGRIQAGAGTGHRATLFNTQPLGIQNTSETHTPEWLDRHVEVMDWAEKDIQRKDVKNTGRNGMSIEAILRCGLLKQHPYHHGTRSCNAISPI